MSCVDVIVVKRKDGTLKSSPFFVRFNQKALRSQLVKIYLDGKRFTPSMEHETQLALNKDDQYCHFKKWAFMKKHEQVNNLRTDIVNNRLKTKSSSTPPSATSPSSTAFSSFEYIRNSRNSKSLSSPSLLSAASKEAKLENLLDMDDCTTSTSFQTAVEMGLLDSELDDVSTLNSPSNSPLSPETPKPSADVQHSSNGSSSSNSSGNISDTDSSGSSDSSNSSNHRSNNGFSVNKSQTRRAASKSLYYTSSTSRTSSSSSSSSSGNNLNRNSTSSQKGFFDTWLESIDNEAHPYDKIVPCSEFLKQMGLNKERTRITYEANGERIEGRIFLWDYRDKLVVSDVDGTITKSDIMGQIFSRLGRDYTHSGIPSLFSKIVQRGYRLIYLTARPITDGQMTRTYIENVKQDGISMPIAPVITTPNTTWSAIAREVIIRRPETFKISILSFVKELFEDNPFVAGWGNRATDCTSYVAVGIDPKMSFRVNTRGEIVVHHCNTFFSSHKQFEMKLDRMNLFPFRRSSLPPIPANLVQKLDVGTSSSNNTMTSVELPPKPRTPRKKAEDEVKEIVEQENAGSKSVL